MVHTKTFFKNKFDKKNKKNITRVKKKLFI